MQTCASAGDVRIRSDQDMQSPRIGGSRSQQKSRRSIRAEAKSRVASKISSGDVQKPGNMQTCKEFKSCTVSHK